MHDYAETLDMVIREAREEQGTSQAFLVEKLGIDIHTITSIEDFRGNPKFEVLYPPATALRIPADRIFYPETDSTGNSKQQLFWELHSLSEKGALELLSVICYLAEMVREHGLENS